MIWSSIQKLFRIKILNKLSSTHFQLGIENSHQGFIVEVDTSEVGLRAVLSDITRFTCTFRSKKLLKNIKLNALSRLFDPGSAPRLPTNILPPSCTVGAVTCGIEKVVRHATVNVQPNG